MKKVVIGFLLTALLLCGCAKKDNPIKTEDEKQTFETRTAETANTAPFSTYHMNYTDNEGFSFVVTCRISPWILQSNTEMLSATWNSIEKDKKLPTINTWGFQKNGDSYNYSEYYITSFDSKIDDMYYAVGTIEIANVTKGFNFSADRVGYPKVQISKDALLDYGKIIITRTYLGDENKTSAVGVVINAEMIADKWCPVPFVIASAEHYTPNNPNGENYDKVEQLPFYLCHAESTNSDSVQNTIGHYE